MDPAAKSACGAEYCTCRPRIEELEAEVAFERSVSERAKSALDRIEELEEELAIAREKAAGRGRVADANLVAENTRLRELLREALEAQDEITRLREERDTYKRLLEQTEDERLNDAALLQDENTRLRDQLKGGRAKAIEQRDRAEAERDRLREALATSMDASDYADRIEEER